MCIRDSLKEAVITSRDIKEEEGPLNIFQHKCLSAACGLPNTGINRDTLRTLLGELSIEKKVMRFAKSVSTFPSVHQLIDSSNEDALEHVQIISRGGRHHEYNPLYNHNNCLPLRIEELADKYNSSMEDFQTLKDFRIDFSNITGKIKALRSQRNIMLQNHKQNI